MVRIPNLNEHEHYIANRKANYRSSNNHAYVKHNTSSVTSSSSSFNSDSSSGSPTGRSGDATNQTWQNCHENNNVRIQTSWLNIGNLEIQFYLAYRYFIEKVLDYGIEDILKVNPHLVDKVQSANVITSHNNSY